MRIAENVLGIAWVRSYLFSEDALSGVRFGDIGFTKSVVSLIVRQLHIVHGVVF